MADNTIRQYRSRGFTQIPNATLYDEGLSLKAKGLLGILLSFPDGWSFFMADLVNRSKDGKDSLLAARRELEAARYVGIQAGRGGGGLFGGLTWHISDTPFDPEEYAQFTEEDFPRRLNRDGESSTSNTQLTNTQSLIAQPEEKQDEERKKSVRQQHAISASMEKSARKKLEELLGDRYKYARDLVNKHGSKAETVLRRLDSTPALLSAFLTLEDDTFAALVERATSEAAKYKSGWQQNIGAQFFDLLGKGVAAHSSGNNSVAAALVDQMEAEFPCPFDPDDFRQVGERSNFISNRKYYFHLRETGENPETEARLKAYLERVIRENSPERSNDESSPEHP